MQLKQLRKETPPSPPPPKKKKAGFNETYLCDTGAVLYLLSYQASWVLVIMWISNVLPVEVKWLKWNVTRE